MPSPVGPPSVYVSSTFADLKDHRAALKTALEKAGFDVACMETYSAFDERPLERCLADVAAADVHVLLIAHRYGYRPPENNPQRRSITQLEYEEASRRGKPRLVFTIDRQERWLPDWVDDGEDKAAVLAFRAEVEERHGVNRFTNPDQLCALVLQALRRLDLRPRAGQRQPFLTPLHLQGWVERHRGRLARAFEALPSVRARRVHVPLEVRLALAAGGEPETRLLAPVDLAPLLEAGGDHVLLLSGDGGAGKTSLAFAIARWWLAGEPDGMVRLPVVLETALAPEETVVERVRSWLRSQLAGAVEDDLAPELVTALLAAKRLIPILDHLSELSPLARERLLGALPPGLEQRPSQVV